MRDNLRSVVWRLGTFVAVCLVVLAGLLAVYGDFRFSPKTNYYADFVNVSGLKVGDTTRIAGVEVGTIKNVKINPEGIVRVGFSADNSVLLTEGTRAAIRYENLFGGRYLALEEGAGGTSTLTAGQVIPVGRTTPALDLDAVIGGFRPLFRALNPNQVNELSEQLINAFQGQGQTIGSFLDQAAAVTNSLADRDVLISQVVDNLNIVLGTLGGQSDQLDRAVVSLAGLVHGLAQRKTAISDAVAYTNAATGSVADLLTKVRPPLQEVVRQTDRAASIVVADHEYLDNLLYTLPDKYQKLVREGISGDFFSFYLCAIVLKFNGKGGQPVYAKIAGQSTGRCTPK